MSSLPKDSFSTPQNGRKNIAHFLCHIAKIPALPRSETQSFLRKKQKKNSKQAKYPPLRWHMQIGQIPDIYHNTRDGNLFQWGPPLRKLGYCLRWKDVCKKQRKKVRKDHSPRQNPLQSDTWVDFFSFIFFSPRCMYIANRYRRHYMGQNDIVHLPIMESPRTGV